MRFDAPPLTPEAPTARRWLGGELARPTYADHQTWLETIRDWLDRHTPGTGSSTGGSPVAAGVLIVLVILVGIVLIRSVGRWRGGPRSQSSRAVVVFGGAALSAAEHRAQARAALDRGDATVAVQEAFRALTRGLQERTLLPERDGLTATEVAGHAAVVLPSFAEPLHRAAGLFNTVVYGGTVPTLSDARALLDLEQQVGAARPVVPAGAR